MTYEHLVVLVTYFAAGCCRSQPVVQNRVNERHLSKEGKESGQLSRVEPRADVQIDSELTSCAPYRGKELQVGRWEDAYTLSRKNVEAGVPVLAVGRIATVDHTGILLDTVCRSSEAQLSVTVKSISCGKVGDIVLVRAITAKPDLLHSLSFSDGPSVLLTDADVLGGVSVQDVCKGKVRQ